MKSNASKAETPLESIELFAGAGGLALGIADGGFHHRAVIELDRWACDTIRYNQDRGVRPVCSWPSPFQGDVRDFDYAPFSDNIDPLF